MSRVFDALLQAGRFRPESGGPAEEELLQSLGVNGAAAVPAAALDPGETPGLEIPPPAAAQAAPAAPESASAVAANVTLYPSAHLIPQSADPSILEYYRRVRTKVLQQQTDKPFRSLIVTSANPQEGKTVTTLNLSMSFAMLPSYRVLVVDGDLRRGTLGTWLGIGDDDYPGLSNLIDGSANVDDVILKSDSMPMNFMVRGNSKAPAGELLHSPQLASYMHTIADRFDLVLVDTPPVNLVADAHQLAACCDAVLLVARAFRTTRKAFEKAVQDVASYRVLGTVLNAGTAARAGGYYGYYGHY
jgi:capsular exopolysaccharide synthesis family protein